MQSYPFCVSSAFDVTFSGFFRDKTMMSDCEFCCFSSHGATCEGVKWGLLPHERGRRFLDFVCEMSYMRKSAALLGRRAWPKITCEI